MNRTMRMVFTGISLSAIFILVTLTGCGNSYSSNGKRIYFTSVSASGDPITYSGGPATMMQRGRLACVDCHGSKGKGGTINMMMQRIEVPGITWTELTSPDSDHPPFTEETLKRAITRGVDETGEALKYPMPRWQMSDSDLNDLVGFIKTLK
jgi:cytochrome c oxidase subunit II